MFKIKTSKFFKQKIKERLLIESNNPITFHIIDENENIKENEFLLSNLKVENLVFGNYISQHILSEKDDIPVLDFIKEINLIDFDDYDHSIEFGIINKTESTYDCSEQTVLKVVNRIEQEILKSDFILDIMLTEVIEVELDYSSNIEEELIVISLVNNNRIVCTIEVDYSLFLFIQIKELDFDIKLGYINKDKFIFYKNIYLDSIEEKLLNKSISLYIDLFKKIYVNYEDFNIIGFPNSLYKIEHDSSHARIIQIKYLFEMIYANVIYKQIIICKSLNEDLEKFENKILNSLFKNNNINSFKFFLFSIIEYLKSFNLDFKLHIDYDLEKDDIATIHFNNPNGKSVYIRTKPKPLEEIELYYNGKETTFFIEDFCERGNEIIDYIKLVDY